MQFSPNCSIPINRLCASERASFMSEGVTMETDGVAVWDFRKTLLGAGRIQKYRALPAGTGQSLTYLGFSVRRLVSPGGNLAAARGY